jgi:EAL domain-containing protein (putative c-di-GMP-specific phosphodiesterase class I)
VDDFGTGYASFSYLREFDPDLVKLDRLFVAGESHPRSQRLLHSLVLMAHHMGKPVVVEGLEEEAQRQRLEDSGCDMVQGYLLGRPVAPDEFTHRYIVPAPI